MLKKLIIACLLFSGSIVAFSQKQETRTIDSLMGVYYQKSLEDQTNPNILLIADTLFALAQKENDKRMQAVALRTKLDHYYYSNDKSKDDSVIVWVNRVMDFAKQNNLPDFYYFVWTSRLINHYIGLGEYNIALAETEKMLNKAEAEDYKEGIADCYFSLSNIYSAKGLTAKSQEFMLKEIEIFEKYNLDRFNITLQYSDAANIYITQGETEKAEELLKKAMEHIKTAYHKVTVKLTYVAFYLATRDITQAARELEECQQMFIDEASLKRHIRYLHEVEFEFYRGIKNYTAALQALDLWEKEVIRRNETVSINSMRKRKADIYWDMNKKEEAGELYRKYLEESEKEKEKNEEITTGEFATLLNMQKLNAEKRELEQLSQERQLQNTQIIVLSLAILLFIVILFLYRQGKLNKKLRKSRDELDEKNQILLKAEEELRQAKDIAEQSSRMKTVFIQNISHEIRTPLNSIVGFSAVLADLFAEESEEVKQFASLIEDNSQVLLKLVGDILEISALDDDLELEYAPVNINACCDLSIEETKPLLSDGVELVFKPGCDKLIIESNAERLLQVLKNLLSNAAKFTHQGNITLAYEPNEEKKELVFTVTDTGIGIPSNEQERIFERFVKLDDFTQGTGLGLPISRIVAEKMGGGLVVDKEYTQGTRFIFSLPIR